MGSSMYFWPANNFKFARTNGVFVKHWRIDEDQVEIKEGLTNGDDIGEQRFDQFWRLER